MLKKNYRLISITITLVIVGCLIMYLINNRNILAHLIEIDYIYIIYLSILWVLTITIPGLRIKVFLKSFSIHLLFSEWFGISIITHMTSMFMPFQTGTLPSAVYLKTRYNFSYAYFASILAGSYILFFLTTCCLGIIVSVFIYLTNNTLDIRFPYFFIIVFILTFVLIILAPKISHHDKGYLEYISRVFWGWHKIKSDLNLVFIVIIIFTVGSLVSAFTFYIGYKALSLDVGFLPIILISLVTQYSIFIKLTPANIGIRETLFAFTSEIAGVGFNEGLLAALLFRGIDLILVVCIGPIFSYILSRNIIQYRKPNGTF